MDIMPQMFELLIALFGFVVTIVGISLKAGRTLQKLDNVIEDVKSLKTEVKEIDRRVTILETKFAEIEKKLPVI